MEEDFENPLYWVAGTGSGASGLAHRGNFQIRIRRTAKTGR